MSQQRSVNKAITELLAEIEACLLRIENRKRKQSQLRELSSDTPIYLPLKAVSHLQLLNLKVWSERYAVSVEFILETLLDYYQHSRSYVCRDTARSIQLGISAATLCGIKSRQVIEEKVLKRFPVGENFRLQKQATLERFWKLQPIERMSYKNLDEMVKSYSALMRERHEWMREKKPYQRAWRGNPWR